MPLGLPLGLPVRIVGSSRFRGDRSSIVGSGEKGDVWPWRERERDDIPEGPGPEARAG